MSRTVFCMVAFALCTSAIRVPIDGQQQQEGRRVMEVDPSNGAIVDSYLIPPDAHRSADVVADHVGAPAVYLLPPTPDQVDYYVPAEDDAHAQTDWLPMRPPPAAQSPGPDSRPRLVFVANNHTSTHDSPRAGKAHETHRKRVDPPSRQLEPPVENKPSEFANSKASKPSDILELPSSEVKHPLFAPTTNYGTPTRKPLRQTTKKNVVEKAPDLKQPLHFTSTLPKVLTQYRNPTKKYPKKFFSVFMPMPIPISQFAENAAHGVPRANPEKPFKPLPNDEYFIPSDEENAYLYQQPHFKPKLKKNNDPKFQRPVAVVPAEDVQYARGVNVPEQQTSETNYRHPGRNAYPAPLRSAPPRAPAPHSAAAPPATPERTEFRMHGMKGPHSYQFGFDTGKGKNRQFRYEERDDAGRVKGHYGYMEKSGKMRVVNYNADPETGFHAEPAKTE